MLSDYPIRAYLSKPIYGCTPNVPNNLHDNLDDNAQAAYWLI